MGFGFNIFFVSIIIPLFGILIVIGILTRKLVIGKIIGIIFIGILVFIMFLLLIQFWTSKKVLKKKDFYGKYVIDRDVFSGKQANWQYNSYRFEIKENDSIYFYVTNQEKILKTYSGKISTIKPYNSERLVLNMNQPTHHIMESNPTIYRSAWSFKLVFYSRKFNNVYFKKGKF